MSKLLLILLMSSVLLGCAGAIHVKDKKSICLGLCMYTEKEATKVTLEDGADKLLALKGKK